MSTCHNPGKSRAEKTTSHHPTPLHPKLLVPLQFRQWKSIYQEAKEEGKNKFSVITVCWFDPPVKRIKSFNL